MIVKASESRVELWTKLTLRWMSYPVSYEIQPQARTNEQGQPTNAYIAHAGIGLPLSSGYYIWLGPRYTTNAQDTGGNRREIRLFEDLRGNLINHKAYSLRTRIRLEQRKELDQAQIANRFRQTLQLKKPWKYKLKWILSNELFENLNRVPWVTSGIIDQNRLFIGFEQTLKHNTRVQIGYLFQFINTSPTQQFNHIIGVALSFDPTRKFNLDVTPVRESL